MSRYEQSLFTLRGAKRELGFAIKDKDESRIEFWIKEVKKHTENQKDVFQVRELSDIEEN